MKTLLMIGFSFILSIPDREVLIYRRFLFESEKSAEMSTLFYTSTKNVDEKSSPVAQGYKAMAAFMMCKHAESPFAKLSYFKEGKRELEMAIGRDSKNVELRFLRLSTQSNSPSFLGYSDSMTEDKELLMRYLRKESASEDPDLRNKITTFILQSKCFTAEEKKIIKSH